MSIAGKWKVTINGPMGAEHTVLELKEGSGGKLMGAQTGKGSTTEISDGHYDGHTITWVNKVTKPIKIKVKFSGVVDGRKMSGKAKPGLLPSVTFSAVKDDT